MLPTEKQSHINRLHRYSLSDWEPLFAFIPLMASPEQPTGNALDSMVWDFVQATTRTPYIMIVFDWGDWQEGKAFLMSDKPTFEHYDLLTLCMLVTTIIRAERFNEGFLMECYKKGIIVNVLNAIKTRAEEQFH